MLLNLLNKLVSKIQTHWIFSTNPKDLKTLYVIFEAITGVVSTVLFLYLTALSQFSDSFLEYNVNMTVISYSLGRW